MSKKGIGFIVLITIGILLNIMFLMGQTLSLFNHDLTVEWGLQESVAELTPVGISWAMGFSFADTVYYIPIFVLGLIGLLKGRKWSVPLMHGSFGVTVYWPICCLFAVFHGRGTFNLMPDKYVSYAILLPLISIYGLWGMWYLHKNQDRLIED